ASRAIVKRAVARGELSPHTPIGGLLDALHGAIVNHSIAAPEHIRSQTDARRRYARQLVDFLLSSLQASTAECGVEESARLWTAPRFADNQMNCCWCVVGVFRRHPWPFQAV